MHHASALNRNLGVSIPLLRYDRRNLASLRKKILRGISCGSAQKKQESRPIKNNDLEYIFSHRATMLKIVGVDSDLPDAMGR